MKIANNEILHKFTRDVQFPRVSFYLPTHRGGPETRQDPIRLKNLAREARNSLEGVGVSPEEADHLLRPVNELCSDVGFLKHLTEGLAVLVAPDSVRHYHLPYTVPERAVVSDRFHLRPLFPLFGSNERFYILALNKNQVGLYEANRYSMRGIEIEEMPQSLAEALRFDDGETQLNYHIGFTGGAITQNSAIFHGQGGEKDIHSDQLLRFFRMVDKGLHDFLREKKAPLILAGVDYYFPIYREANSYPHLFEKGVAGSTEGMTAKEMHDKAWELLNTSLEKEEREAIERFHGMAGNGNGSRTAADLESVLPAACQGRVESLFVSDKAEKWGEFDEENQQLKAGAAKGGASKDLFDFASIKTLENGGSIYLLPEEKMPDRSQVSAILRYGNGKTEGVSAG